MSGFYFVAGGFFIAGIACAFGPMIIHLLNRRRYKVVNWAAMDFLRQALQRNRRIMQIRDIVLLLLRTAAVFLFGLALAQPYFTSTSDEEFNAQRSGPVHAVLILDNSMSMGYSAGGLGETQLDVAKEKANEFIKRLPVGSRISVVPLCGSASHFSLDPYRTPSDAIEAVNHIQTVDRGRPITEAVSLAQKAAEAEPSMSKRIVVFSDQQVGNWTGIRAAQLKQFPPLQLVSVAASEPENSWIEELRLEDGIADVETPAKFTVRVRHQGAWPRKNVPLRMTVGGEELAPKTIDLEPGTAAQEYVFEHTFAGGQADVSIEAAKVTYVPVKVTLGADEHDRLAADNERHIVVPVVAALPVVFVDEQGEQGEENSRNDVGESWQLRRLLAPIVDRNVTARQLVRVKHVTLDQLTQDVLADVRLVVIAGVDDPELKVDLLREYVEQGGQLLITAGGQFNPRAWTAAAWNEGNGILPAPLEPDMIGSLPTPQSYSFFRLDYNGEMKNHSWFRLGGEPDETLAAMYSDPIFFQAVRVHMDSELAERLIEQRRKWLEENLPELATAQQRERKLAELESSGTPLTAEQETQLRADRELLSKARPDWLQWNDNSGDISLPNDPDEHEAYFDRLARQAAPQVLARFDNGAPYIVERGIGKGRAVFCASGVRPLGASLTANTGWNTLARENAILMFDRIMRSMIRSTLPDRNFVAADSITLPLDGDTRRGTYELHRPASGEQISQHEPLTATFTSSRTRGLTIRNALKQGVYTITAYSGDHSADEQDTATPTTIQFSISPTAGAGASESELQPLTRDEFDTRTEGEAEHIQWIDREETISLAGATVRGYDWWWYLALIVLLLLLCVELPILAWPMLMARLNPSPAAEAT